MVFAAALILGASNGRGESAANAEQSRIRVACVGDSITFGADLPDREKKCYPAQLQRLLGERYDVRNEGCNGRTMLRHGDFPYSDCDAFRDALAFNPDIVVISLAINDSKPKNWKFKDEFTGDAQAMIKAFRALPAKPRVLLCLPTPTKVIWEGIDDDSVLVNELIPMLRQIAFDTGTELVDLHTAFLNKEAWLTDGVHLDSEGAAFMAKVIGSVLDFKAEATFNIEASLATNEVAVKVSSFFGYRQLTFAMEDGCQCIVVRPYVTSSSRPYAWRGEFFGHEPQTDLALLQHGYHVVYVDTSNMYGSPPAMVIWEKFRALLGRAGLNGKMTLVGMSRGGLYCYNWAALHPETVSVIYGDAPVCDFKSWPGGKLRDSTSQTDWANLIRVYGFKDEAEAFAYKRNPVDNLEPLARNGISIIHVVGQADSVVPVQDNTDVIEKRYRALGGTIEVIRKPGVGHHPHSLPNPEPIVDFILNHQNSPLHSTAGNPR
jgi:lysophospholipase L1-like esterase/pimeloyl-ACP methyl ester carboxylesterase